MSAKSSSNPSMNRFAVILAGFALSSLVVAATASTLTVKVSGVRSDTGQVVCALFATADGFPMKTGNALLQWVPADRAGVTCRFDGLKAGTYAIAVTHDLNGNHRTDTDFLGRPTEDWGVSRGARPRLRAPRFDEAAFTVGDDDQLQIDVQVGR
jgi:uncharacterized protein (DUF2141 family)